MVNKLLSKEQVAKILEVPTAQIDQLVASGIIKTVSNADSATFAE